MTYFTQSQIATNGTMYGRVTQAAAEEGIPAAESWTFATRHYWAAAPGWDDAWDSALASHPDDPTYDPAADEAVITDGMILSQVQSMNTEQGGNTR